MRNRLQIAGGLALGALSLGALSLGVLGLGTSAVSCLPEISDDHLPANGFSSGSGDTGACVGECCPSETICYPNGDNTAPGSECLASRDNRGQDRVQLRSVWTRTILPAANSDDITYSFLLAKTALDLQKCNMIGTSGYIQMFDWDRSATEITEQTARVGYAAFEGDAEKALTDGLCFLDFMYSDPEHGWMDEVHVKPTEAKRLAEDFDVHDPAFRAMYGTGDDGVFYYDEAMGSVHGYSPRAYLTIFENENDVFVVPAREAELRGQFNDPETLNCQGVYRSADLDPNASCQAASQLDPAFGCPNDECESGQGPASTEAYFLIEDLELVHVTLLNTTLCVSYMGQQTAIDEGWADPSDWGLNCAGSPKWIAGERPRGDWCSTTNAPATADCADAWKSENFSVAAGTKIVSGTCSTDAR